MIFLNSSIVNIGLFCEAFYCNLNIEPQSPLQDLVSFTHLLLDMIKEFYDELVITSSDFFLTLEMEYCHRISSKAKNSILTRLGYLMHLEKVKINGMVKKIWYKKPMTSSEIREHFENKKEGFLDDFDTDL